MSPWLRAQKTFKRIGTIIRNGVEIFYRNVKPYHLGLTQEFSPRDVI